MTRPVCRRRSNQEHGPRLQTHRDRCVPWATDHRGADISRLSQFAGEEEVLFPPCTMLEVKREPIKHVSQAVEAVINKTSPTRARRDTRAAYSQHQVCEQKEDGMEFLQVTVLPSFR